MPLVLTALLLTCGIAHCAEVTVEENASYGKAGDMELKLDMARRKGDGPFPAIMFIHRGG